MPRDDDAVITLVPDADYYRVQAARFRRMAKAVSSHNRDYLLDMASHFERLAVTAADEEAPAAR